MAYHHHHHHQGGGVCSPGVIRLVLLVVSIVLVGYVLGPSLFWHISGKVGVGGAASSCPPCVCDCSSQPEATLSLPLGLINNNSLADCGKHDPELNEELKKDIIDLLREELSLLRNVTQDNLQHTKTSILEARKTSSQYQKEADKCTSGVETCEEAREKAEAELRAERKVSEMWETRARQHGWKDLRRAYLL